MNGATKPPEAASTCIGTSRPVSRSSWSSAAAISFDRLVAAVERRSEDRDHADRVLVAVRDRLLGVEVVAVALHRHQPRLDVPVAAELLPADLDVDAGDEVRPVGRLAGGAHAARASAT